MLVDESEKTEHEFVDYYKKELIFYNNACLREFQNEVDALTFKMDVYAGLLKHMAVMKVHASFLQEKWCTIENQYDALKHKMQVRLVARGIVEYGVRSYY